MCSKNQLIGHDEGLGSLNLNANVRGSLGGPREWQSWGGGVVVSGFSLAMLFPPMMESFGGF